MVKRAVLLGLVASLMTVSVFTPRPVFSHETLTTTVLFDREIVRILNKHCVMCHVENGPSFPLATYEDTWLSGRKIKSAAIARHMPPWAAVPGYGRFANENTLTLREMQFLVAWVEGNGPRNAGTVFQNVVDSGVPRPKVVRAEANFGQWRLGTPSLTRPLPAAAIERRRSNVTRTVVDLGLTSARWVRALEYMPRDRRLVRAAFFTLQETGQWLGSWTPWYGFVSLPEGSAYRLPAGARIVAEIHYKDANDQVVEQGTLGLFVADSSRFTPSDLVLDAKGDVPAAVASKKFRAQQPLTADTYALALRLETQPGVTSIEVANRKPDGGTEILLFAEGLSMEWPTPYIFATPVRLPKGSVLSVTAYYANTTGAAQPGGVRLTVSQYVHRAGPEGGR